MTGLPGARLGRAQEPVLHPPRRLPRGLHGPAGEADGGGDQLLQRPTSARRPTARISVLRRGDHAEDAAGPPPDQPVGHASSSTRTSARSPTFVFDKPIPVKKGNWIALTVPTWAPLLADEPAARRTGGARRGPKDSCEPPKSLQPVRDGGAARGERVRLHLPRRPAAVHRHVRPEQPRDEPGRLKLQKGLQPAAPSR